MPPYKIHYKRPDMNITCTAIKYAHTESEALEHLCHGNKTKGFTGKKSGVSFEIINIEEDK